LAAAWLVHRIPNMHGRPTWSAVAGMGGVGRQPEMTSAIEGSPGLDQLAGRRRPLAKKVGVRSQQKGGPSMRSEGSAGPVSIGLDAAVVANHRVAVRGATTEDFGVAASLVGLRQLTERLSSYAPAMVVMEPTAMSWLGLGYAVADAGCRPALVESRHTAKLRGAVAGKNKSDVIDADMLASCAELFGLSATVLPGAEQLALRRAVHWRHRAVVTAHSADCRLWGLAAWAFPDLWRACKGSHLLARALLGRWPRLDRLARARQSTVAQLCRVCLRGPGDPAQRAERIVTAAAGWAAFWQGRVDLDALAWETVEILGEIEVAEVAIGRATAQAVRCWRQGWGDDEVLCSIPGIGPIIAPVIRAWWARPGQFPTAKQAAAFVGLNPSNWESGLMASPSRPITKEGPPELRLAFYQAANVARRRDPQLAVFYQRLMVNRAHHHIQATCAVGRKLACRVWATLEAGQPYRLRDLDGQPVDEQTAAALAASYAVPEHIRRRARARSAGRKRGRLSV
jgi:transposase